MSADFTICTRYSIESVPLKDYNKYVVIVIWRKYMEVLTSTEMAKKWGLSRRRVTTYCTNGRIEGAIMKGNTWLIPDNAIKPEDPRRTRKNSDEIEEGAK